MSYLTNHMIIMTQVTATVYRYADMGKYGESVLEVSSCLYKLHETAKCMQLCSSFLTLAASVLVQI